MGSVMGLSFREASSTLKMVFQQSLLFFVAGFLTLEVRGQGALIPVPCTFANNTIGECECPGQLFVHEECHHGFYCLNQTQFPGYEGCDIRCQDWQVLVVDPRNAGSWKCQNALLINVCPGAFNTECGCNDGSNPDCEIGPCACAGQLWVDYECKTARYCKTGAADDYEEETCGEGQIVYVDLTDNSWACGDDDGRCPGAFHVGCQDDDYTTTTTATTTTVMPDSSSSLIVSFSMIIS